MKPLDQSGNMLDKGDFVALHLGNQVMRGVITEIEEASTVMSRNNEMLPGSIKITIPWTIKFTPMNKGQCQGIFKLVKPPDFDKKVGEVIPKSNA